MFGRALKLLLVISLFSVFTVKGGYPDVLCIHYQEGVAHVEKEHPELPGDEDEIHLKLIPDASLKVFKLSLDEFVSGRESVLNLTLRRPVRAPSPSKALPPRGTDSPVRTVRLLI